MFQSKFIKLAGIIIIILGGVMMGMNFKNGADIEELFLNAPGILFVGLGLAFVAISEKQKK